MFVKLVSTCVWVYMLLSHTIYGVKSVYAHGQREFEKIWYGYTFLFSVPSCYEGNNKSMEA